MLHDNNLIIDSAALKLLFCGDQKLVMYIDRPPKPSLAAFSKALVVLHDSDRPDSLMERVFGCFELLYPGDFVAFDHRQPGSSQFKFTLNRPIPNQAACLSRLNELGVAVHPVYSQFENRPPDRSIAILSDHCSLAEWEQSAVFKEVWKPSEVGRDQVVFFLNCESLPSGIGLCRHKPFTDADRNMVTMLAPHLKLAFSKSGVLSKAMSAMATVEKVDFEKWRQLGLSRRECEVLAWVCEGKTDWEIAVILGLSRRTVNHHISRLLQKLRVNNRVAATRLATELLLRDRAAVPGRAHP